MANVDELNNLMKSDEKIVKNSARVRQRSEKSFVKFVIFGDELPFVHILGIDVAELCKEVFERAGPVPTREATDL